ncbi:MAG: Xaa-Pro peptidase family protein [Firmicutes bacterium]|nr:Xaa-Pro peptidase family protein [Bacillota bacterium]
MKIDFEKNKIEALVAMSPENRFYLTDFPSSFGCAVLTEKEKIFITDTRYSEAAKAIQETFKIVTIKSGEKLHELLAGEFKRLGIENVGYEDSFMTVSSFKNLKDGLKDFKLKGISDYLSELRSIKTEEERQRIATAQEIAEEAFKKVRRNIKVGMSEREVYAELVWESLRTGADGMSFDPIVAFGENSAKPHHNQPTERRLEKKDIILIDFGVKHKGYCSDMTRTFSLGPVANELQVIYDIVLKAQEYALKHIKAGMTGHEADALAREYIKSNGYGEQFGHSLGHGIGINVHEMPRIADKSKCILKEGMVITCEPGIYLEGLGGVRIEDMVVVTESGIINMTYCDKILEL